MRSSHLAAIWCLWSASTASTDTLGFFRTDGQDILDPSGRSFVSHGIALSGWLNMEAYLFRLNDVHHRHLNAHSSIVRNVYRILGGTSDATEDVQATAQAHADEFWQSFRENFVTAADISHLAALGVNAIRVPFNYRLLSPVDQPGVYLEDGFQVLDQLIGWCADNEVAVLLDMHALPGSQSHEQYADPEYTFWREDEATGRWLERGVATMWEDTEEYIASTGRTAGFNQQRAADLWKVIAERYKDEPYILGYELVNEPYYYKPGVTDADLRSFIQIVTASIREVDSNHIVVVEGNVFAEEIGGLLPPFDDNMAVAFHRSWRPADYSDGMLMEYLEAREQHNIPLIMSEFGENSNGWFSAMAGKMEGHNIGWFAWGWKKVNAITTGYSARISADYQYVIDNWRDNPDIDPIRARQGLMDMAESLKTENCNSLPGYFHALLDPTYNSDSVQYTTQATPGVVQAVQYDIGNQGIAYNDTEWKVIEHGGDPYNKGWAFRNDGVDIRGNVDNDNHSIGFHISDTVAGEWLAYTVDVTRTGTYRVSYRVTTPYGGKLQLMHEDSTDSLTGIVSIDSTDGWSNWQTQAPDATFPLTEGVHTLRLQIVEGGFDLAWMQFTRTSTPIDAPSGAPLSEEPNSFPISSIVEAADWPTVLPTLQSRNTKVPVPESSAPVAAPSNAPSNAPVSETPTLFPLTSTIEATDAAMVSPTPQPVNMKAPVPESNVLTTVPSGAHVNEAPTSLPITSIVEAADEPTVPTTPQPVNTVEDPVPEPSGSQVSSPPALTPGVTIDLTNFPTPSTTIVLGATSVSPAAEPTPSRLTRVPSESFLTGTSPPIHYQANMNRPMLESDGMLPPPESLTRNDTDVPRVPEVDSQDFSAALSVFVGHRFAAGLVAVTLLCLGY